MPVILEDEFVDDWLYVRQSSSSLLELLRPAREDLLIGTPVSTRVNSVKNDDPDCLLPTDRRAPDRSTLTADARDQAPNDEAEELR